MQLFLQNSKQVTALRRPVYDEDYYYDEDGLGGSVPLLAPIEACSL